MIDDARNGTRATDGGMQGVYSHKQSSPAATWTINHNLGYAPDVVTFVGGVRVYGNVAHPTLNQAVVTFLEALVGTARCS